MKLPLVLKNTTLIASLSVLASFGFTSFASATAASTSSAKKPTTTQSAQLKTVIAQGDSKIAIRFTDLSKLSTKVQSLSKVTAANKAVLLGQINSTVTGLTNLKNKLDKDTDLATAKTDEGQITTNYRVFLLVIPRVHLIKVADDEQLQEFNWGLVASIIQTYVNQSPQKDALTKQMNDATQNLQQANAISLGDEAHLLAMTAGEYNAEHVTMGNYLTHLKTAEPMIAKAKADMKAVVTTLKAEHAVSSSTNIQ